MNKDFSDGFMQDLASLLEYCAENKTDFLELHFNINGTELNVDMMFSVVKKEGGIE